MLNKEKSDYLVAPLVAPKRDRQLKLIPGLTTLQNCVSYILFGHVRRKKVQLVIYPSISCCGS